MNLAIFLAFKEGAQQLEDTGQLERMLTYYVYPYAKHFEHVYIFGWNTQPYSVPNARVTYVPNPGWPLYIYPFVLPFVHRSILAHCARIRLMQATAVIPAVIAKIRFKSAVIATYGFPYGAFLRIRKRYVQALLWTIVERLFLSFVDVYITTYAGTATYLKEHGIPTMRIHLAPNGVDINTFKPSSKPKSSDTIELLFVGRFEPEKNILALAHALALLAQHYSFHITLIGRGALEDAARDILDDNGVSYTLTGTVPHASLVQHYQNTDIFVLPSLAEGYPKVLVEALACGCACVVGAYLGHEQIIEDGTNGIVCGHTPEEIADALSALIEDQQLRQKIGASARQFAVAHNNIHTIVAEEIKLIQSPYENT